LPAPRNDRPQIRGRVNDMLRGTSIRDSTTSFAVIVAAYVLSHGITTFLVTPVQGYFLAEITVFASLVYLPHGVRVLSTWLIGPKAFLPLFAGGVVSALMFTPGALDPAWVPAVMKSTAVGALSAPLAFALLRLAGGMRISANRRRIDWKSLVLAGVVASGINSAGQALVHGARFPSADAVAVVAVYAIGDLIGLLVTMVALMMIFRWIRRMKG